MAIYHFSVQVISRAAGRSAVAAAAYRAASRLHDERLERTHDFSNKAGVVHSEVMLPEHAPEAWRDRERLWNDVEGAEKRKDAQLSREVEFAIPREMNQQQGITLARDFVQREFVDRGMVADLNVHWDIGADGMAKPHAHVMLTMREAGEAGFGPKVRDWNRTELVEQWRERWAGHVNRALAELDIDAAIDHRSLAAQRIDLEPQSKIGAAALRMERQGLEADRADEHREIARENGARIIANPGIALDAITHNQATFTTRDLAMFVHRHSDGIDQFNAVMSAVRASPDLVALGKDGRGEDRFTSREMIEVEQRLEKMTGLLASRSGHGLPAALRGEALDAAGSGGLVLGGSQQTALLHVTDTRDLAIVVGYAGTGKSAMLGVARDGWERAGYTVRGLALSGIAAENLESGSGIASRTIASMEHEWTRGREQLSARDVLVIDEAGMVGTRQMERVLSNAAAARAKVVLVGDPQQLQSIEAGAAFRAIHERHGGVEITEVRRQRVEWQQGATRQLATGRTTEALDAYREHGMAHVALTREAAREDLVERWNRDRLDHPEASRIILTHSNEDRLALNLLARARMMQAHALGEDVTVRTAAGERTFAPGDRVMLLRNDSGLAVKNGMLGRVDQISRTRMAVMLDSGRRVGFDLKDYAHIDHGYAATIHKAQGMTVDRVHVLATPGMDAHTSYVALSRHRDRVELHYGRDDFADDGRLARALSRERGKDMASDYPGAAQNARNTAPDRPGSSRQPGLSDRIEPRAAPRSRHRWQDSPELPGAVARHARIVAALLFAQRVGEPATPEQKAELGISRAALNRFRPEGARDLESAFAADHGLIREASAGRTQTAIRAMQLEAEMRIDPKVRADVFVERWQALDNQRRLLLRDREDGRAHKVANTMAGMAKSLERDPQVESILRNRKAQLGLPEMPGRGVGQSLADLVGLGRNRGPEIGM